MTKERTRNTVVITKRRQSVMSAMQNSNRSLPLRPSEDACGDFDIRITADGKWHYQGSPITRMSLVRLFAGVLKRDAAGDYWLETPTERGRIQVDDAPFIAVEVSIAGTGRSQQLQFRTNIDETVTADAAHPIHLRPGRAKDSGGLRPYLGLRDDIEALIARPVYYSLVEIAVEHPVDGMAELGVWSNGVFFPLGPAAPGEFSDGDAS
jgi:hypothetical protein